MMRRFLALFGLAPLRDLEDVRTQRRHLNALVDHLKRAAAERVRSEMVDIGGGYRVSGDVALRTPHLRHFLPNTADDPPPFGRADEVEERS